MRILYLHQHFSVPAGSVATRSHAMARALAARGHAVTIACGRYDGAVSGLDGPFRHGRRSGRVNGFSVVEFDIACGNHLGLAARSLAFLAFAARAMPLALSRHYDLVIASSTPLTVAVPALVARRLRGTPFVFEIRDPWPELPRALLRAQGAAKRLPRMLLAMMEPLANDACRNATAVIALSEGMAETAIMRGADPARVHVVPNGCDLDLFGPHIAPWRPAEAQPWECLAVYAGAHGPANGLDRLLDAAALLRDEATLRILLVGEGAEKQRLIARARAEGLANVTFLGPMPKTSLATLLAGCQIGVHMLEEVPHFAEWTSPNKLMDYLAAGLPVVTNVAGHAARLIEGGATPCGIAAMPGDVAALAAALRTLATDPVRRGEMGRNARAQAVRRWDRRLLAAQFCEVAERAIATPPRTVLAMP